MTKASRGRSSPRHQYSRCPWTVPRADGRTAVASAQPIAVPVANPALWCESPCCSRFAGRHRRRVPRNVHSALIAQHRSARSIWSLRPNCARQAARGTFQPIRSHAPLLFRPDRSCPSIFRARQPHGKKRSPVSPPRGPFGLQIQNTSPRTRLPAV